MIQNYKPSHIEEYVDYDVVFDDGRGNGYWFPCDEHGNLLSNVYDCAKTNYAYCMAHQDEFVRANQVITHRRRVREPATGTCKCGDNIELKDQYYGACMCTSCGQWYNMFGQELLPPDEWGDELEYDE